MNETRMSLQSDRISTQTQERVKRAVPFLLAALLVFVGNATASAGTVIISGTATLPNGKPLVCV